jgi:hypothetical protein
MFVSAIHGQYLACNKRGYIAEEEDGSIRDVLYMA